MARRKRFHYKPGNTDKQREASWKAQGIEGATVMVYNTLLLNQKGRCAICQRPQTGKRLALDHDHKTGQIRGLLCKNCNYNMGYFEVGNRLPKMLEYLSYKHKVED